MKGEMAINIALPGLNDLGGWVRNFSFDGLFSQPIFYVKQKNEENLSIRSLNFLQNASSDSAFLAQRKFEENFRANILKQQRRQRRHRGRRLVKNKFIFYQRNSQLSRSVQCANGSG